MINLVEPFEFEWDQGNRDKNWIGHQVTHEECEEIFYDPDKKLYNDIIHSLKEDRYLMIGKTKAGRILFVVFTMRKRRLRVISARDLNRKEKFLYEK